MQVAKQLSQDSLISRLDELPTLPSIVYELSRVINDPMSSTGDVEKIMHNDPSLTAKVLKLVNSAYYAIPGGVSSLARAIAYIGFDTVNQLVLSASILKALEAKGPQRFDMNEFWKHSIGVGIGAETLAKVVGHPTPADLFTCGLVHDMGKIALYTLEPDLMLSIIDHAKENSMTYCESENALEIPSHTKLGQMLANKWRLPKIIQNCIAYHHSKDPNQRGGLAPDFQRNVDIVFMANLLINALKFGKSGHEKILGAPKEVFERMGVNPETQLKQIIGDIKGNLDKAQDFLRVLGGGQ